MATRYHLSSPSVLDGNFRSIFSKSFLKILQEIFFEEHSFDGCSSMDGESALQKVTPTGYPPKNALTRMYSRKVVKYPQRVYCPKIFREYFDIEKVYQNASHRPP